MKFLIHTPRLILRLFRMSDLDTFQAYRSDPLVAKYQGWDVPYPRAKAETYINELLNRHQLISSEWMQIAVERLEDNQMIGDCAFHLLPGDSRQAEIGYTLAQSYWGNGFGVEAVTALLGFLFEEAGLHRVIAGCDVLNTGSIRLLERVGMRREAHFIENIFLKGVYGSEYQYAILAWEWKKSHETL